MRSDWTPKRAPGQRRLFRQPLLFVTPRAAAYDRERPGPDGEGAMRGIDVHQDKGDPDWKRVRAAGFGFAWLKVSEGVGFPPTNEWYGRNRMAARAAGLRVGGYHYLTTKGGGSTPEQEAAFFLGRLDLQRGDVLPVCDYEQEPADAIRRLRSSRRSKTRSASGRSSTPSPTTWPGRRGGTTSGATPSGSPPTGPTTGSCMSRASRPDSCSSRISSRRRARSREPFAATST